MTDEQCYEVLKLKPGATEQEILDQRRKLARLYHSDNYKNDPELEKIGDEELKKINSAVDQLLKSLKNPNYKQPNNPNNNPTPKVYQPTDNNTVIKRKASRRGLVALGILGVVIFMCGSGVYFIGSLITGNKNPQNDNNPFSQPSNPANKETIKTDYGKKVSGLSFSPTVLAKFSHEDSRFSTDSEFTVRPLSIEKYEKGNLKLNIAYCNVGRTSGTLQGFTYYYTPANGLSSIKWDEFHQVKLDAGECQEDEYSTRETYPSFQFSRPFGKLNMRQGVSDSVVTIDLNAADSKGSVTVN